MLLGAAGLEPSSQTPRHKPLVALVELCGHLPLALAIVGGLLEGCVCLPPPVSALFSLLSALYSQLFALTLHSALCTLPSVFCALLSVLCSLLSAPHSALCSLLSARLK